MLKRTMRKLANVMKNLVVLTDNAPQARTKGISGKGGGRRAGRVNAKAPLVLTSPLAFSSTAGEIQCSSPFSPILRPIQKTIAAAITDDAVAKNGKRHTISE